MAFTPGGMTWQPNNNQRTKASDKISLPELPMPKYFLTWRQQIRKAIAAASSRPQEAWQWIMAL
eukprot:5993480-Heterocapsa_arctica.AAC.1